MLIPFKGFYYLIGIKLEMSYIWNWTEFISNCITVKTVHWKLFLGDLLIDTWNTFIATNILLWLEKKLVVYWNVFLLQPVGKVIRNGNRRSPSHSPQSEQACYGKLLRDNYRNILVRFTVIVRKWYNIVLLEQQKPRYYMLVFHTVCLELFAPPTSIIWKSSNVVPPSLNDSRTLMS